MLSEPWVEFRELDERLKQVSRQIEALAAHDEAARRLMTIPGIGPLGATALPAAIGNPKQFREARYFPLGSGWYHGNTRPAARPRYLASPSAAILT